jgi:hypothetical protein
MITIIAAHFYHEEGYDKTISIRKSSRIVIVIKSKYQKDELQSE